jgi:hypothetical protein
MTQIKSQFFSVGGAAYSLGDPLYYVKLFLRNEGVIFVALVSIGLVHVIFKVVKRQLTVPDLFILSMVFVGIIVGGSEKAGDDAASLEWVDLAGIEQQQIAFDHVTILRDYKKWKVLGGTYWSTKRRNE